MRHEVKHENKLQYRCSLLRAKNVSLGKAEKNEMRHGDEIDEEEQAVENI